MRGGVGGGAVLWQRSHTKWPPARRPKSVPSRLKCSIQGAPVRGACFRREMPLSLLGRWLLELFMTSRAPQPFPSPMAPNTTCTKLTRSKRLRRPSRRKELQMSDTRNIPFASKIKTEKPSGEENGFGFPSRDRIQSNPIELSKESAFNWNSGSARQRLLFYWKATQTYSFVP